MGFQQICDVGCGTATGRSFGGFLVEEICIELEVFWFLVLVWFLQYSQGLEYLLTRCDKLDVTKDESNMQQPLHHNNLALTRGSVIGYDCKVGIYSYSPQLHGF